MLIRVVKLPQWAATILYVRRVREFLFLYQTMKCTVDLFEIY